MTTEVKVTKKQNVKVNGVKHVAHTHIKGSRLIACVGCSLTSIGKCHEVPCAPRERADGRSVFFKLAK